MFITRGYYPLELGDVDVIVHEDCLHLFYLNVSGHDVVSHIVSDDGMHWRQLPNALHTGDPGEPDDDQIWTMHTFRWQGRFYMLYTCLAQAEDGRIQRTGLAVSDDLIHWEKVPHNPVAVPDPRWYEADLSGCGRADWRDPFPFIEGGVIHGLVCAHEKDGPFNRRGCVAHITSTDALHWRVRPPFYTPRVSSDFEVPCIFRLGGRYYLMGHICAPPMDVYRISDRLEGPWRRPLDDLLLPTGNHAFHACEWRGKMMIFNWIGVAAFDETRQPTRILAPPKVAGAMADGTLRLHPYEEGWNAVATEAWRSWSPQAVFTQGAVLAGEWSAQEGALVGTSQPGMGVYFLPDEFTDFELETTVSSADAPEFGLVFRSDATADEYMRLSCIQGRQTLELAVVLRRGASPILGRGFESLQIRHHPFAPGRPFRLRLSAYGPYLEVSVDDDVRLATVNLMRRRGKLGFFVEDGTARFADLRLRRLEAPPMRLPPGPIV